MLQRLIPPVNEKDSQAYHWKADHEREGKLLPKKKCSKEHAEDGAEKGEGREPPYWVFVNEIEPDQEAEKTHDHRLVENGSNNDLVYPPNPMGFKKKAQHKKNRDGKDELIEKGVDGAYLFCHVSFDIKCGCPPEESGEELQQVTQEHRWFGCRWPPSENDEDSRKSENEACYLDRRQAIALEQEMSTHGHNKWTRVDEDDRARCIRVEQTHIDAGKLQTKEETYHEPMKEHDVGVKEFLPLAHTIDHPADGGDDRPQRRGEDGSQSLIRVFHGNIVKPPEAGQNQHYQNGPEVEVILVFLDHCTPTNPLLLTFSCVIS